MELNFSWLSRYSFGRTTQTAVSTQTLNSHKQEAILQNSEIEGGPQSSFPRDPRNSGEVDAERVRLGCRSSGSPLAGHRQISATKSGSYISLLVAVRLKKAVVNIKNKDDHCLRWALRSALFPARDHVDRLSKYPTDDGLSFEGIDAPTPISQIKELSGKTT